MIDLRSEAEFAAYHIPTAENVPLSALPDFPLQPNEKVVLYSEGGIHAAQAWFLIRAQGHRAVYTVLGGLDGWKDEVLFPEMPGGRRPAGPARFERAPPSPDSSAASRGRPAGRRPPEVAGTAVGCGPGDSRTPDDWRPRAPGLASPVTAPKKKKKEGC